MGQCSIVKRDESYVQQHMNLKNDGERKKPAKESPVWFLLCKGQKQAKLNNISYRIYTEVMNYF